MKIDKIFYALYFLDSLYFILLKSYEINYRTYDFFKWTF